MERFAAVDDQYDPHAVEERVFDYWDAVDAYERTKAHRADGEDFYFLDGPPYTTGAPHMGTAWNKTLKDAYIRYHRMQGYDVYDRPGYDMHGLPIETGVEEELGFETKKDIQDFGVEAFIEECKAFAADNLETMNAAFQSIGVWMDWDDPYKTVDPAYMEAAWWGFQRVHERGLLERGKRSISYCPRCETAIANNEVEYHEVEDPSIYVKLPLADREGALVVWTTTPWTLPGNTFVAVDEELTYVGVRAEKDGEHERLYVAEPVVEEVLKAGRYADYEVVEELPGEDLVGWTYEHPLAEAVPDHPQGEGALTVYHADYVEADRSGLVHSAPGHGEEDFQRGRELGLELFCPVGEDGVFTDEAGDYAGTFVREANDDIVADLDRQGLLLAEETLVHDYGQCWRCDTDIIQIVTDQWFINTSEFKAEMLDLLAESDWYPEWARDNRFRDFVEESPDWNVSRQRYWGIPLPIWTPEDWDGDVDEVVVVGTREELAERADQDVDPETVDLHKPTVDDLTITEDGTTYTRVPDVFDVWLDSGVASWGALNYPEEAADFEALWPMDLIIEAHDQTRGWFWSLLAMGTVVFEENPYEGVLMHGHTLAEDGRKMSKSVGNVVEPSEAIERHGRDVMRLFLLSASPQGDDMRFSWDEMGEMARRLNILWNVFRFPLPYMRLDGFDPDAVALEDAALTREDRWLLARLQTVVDEATEGWADFRQDRALEALLDFVVDDLSRYYVQLVRERMWAEADSPAKTAAYATLYHALRQVVALLAPYAPFVAEVIYGHLTGEAGHPTVHMCDWPTPDDRYRDDPLESAIETVRTVEEAGSHARQEAGRKLRWPVRRVVVDATDETVADALDDHADLLAERLNAREVAVVGPGGRWDELRWGADADMSVLGPALGDRAGEVMGALNDARVDEPTLAALEAAVEAETGDPVELTEDMVEPVAHPPADVVGADFDGGTVYVDTGLTDELEAEGYAREVIRRVQEMRKELDLAVEQRIRLEVEVFDERVGRLVARHEDLIAEEVRAAELGEVEDGHEREWDVEGVRMRFAVEPLEETVA
ncbi:MAG: isoleucine--tRNA ligase [Halobacteriales archaeon]